MLQDPGADDKIEFAITLAAQIPYVIFEEFQFVEAEMLLSKAGFGEALIPVLNADCTRAMKCEFDCIVGLQACQVQHAQFIQRLAYQILCNLQFLYFC